MFSKKSLRLFLLIISGIVALALALLTTDLSVLKNLFVDRQILIDYVHSFGDWAPAVFIAIQSIQVIAAPIPGELTGAIGGALFGAFWGTIYATLGLAIGSSVAFILGRSFGEAFLKGTSHPTVNKYLALLKHEKSLYYFTLLFLFPGFPKDILSYIAGLSAMSFAQFLVFSNLARLPGTIMLCMSGDFVMEGEWKLLAVVSALALALFVLGKKLKKSLNKSNDI